MSISDSLHTGPENVIIQGSTSFFANVNSGSFSILKESIFYCYFSFSEGKYIATLYFQLISVRAGCPESPF